VVGESVEGAWVVVSRFLPPMALERGDTMIAVFEPTLITLSSIALGAALCLLNSEYRQILPHIQAGYLSPGVQG
jgi:hypothetical protein